MLKNLQNKVSERIKGFMSTEVLNDKATNLIIAYPQLCKAYKKLLKDCRNNKKKEAVLEETMLVHKKTLLECVELLKKLQHNVSGRIDDIVGTKKLKDNVSESINNIEGTKNFNEKLKDLILVHKQLHKHRRKLLNYCRDNKNNEEEEIQRKQNKEPEISLNDTANALFNGLTKTFTGFFNNNQNAKDIQKKNDSKKEVRFDDEYKKQFRKFQQDNSRYHDRFVSVQKSVNKLCLEAASFEKVLPSIEKDNENNQNKKNKNNQNNGQKNTKKGWFDRFAPGFVRHLLCKCSDRLLFSQSYFSAQEPDERVKVRKLSDEITVLFDCISKSSMIENIEPLITNLEKKHKDVVDLYKDLCFRKQCKTKIDNLLWLLGKSDSSKNMKLS